MGTEGNKSQDPISDSVQHHRKHRVFGVLPIGSGVDVPVTYTA